MTQARINVRTSAVQLYVALAICGFSITALTATSNAPLACLDDDVREAFFHSDYLISRESLDSLPPSLRKLEPPEGFRLVGSVATSSYARVGLITTLDVASAEQKVVQALSGLGYKTREIKAPAIGERRQRSGFSVQRRPRGQVHMCHPVDGRLLVLTRERELGTIVTATRYNQGDSYCVRLYDIYQGKFSNDFLPNLELPQNAREQQGGGGSGTVNHALSRTTFISDDSLPELLTFFGQQLAEQGWRLDGAWSTESTLGTVWSSSAQQGALRLVGLLEVSALSGASYQAIMSVSLYD